jgi:hypothetical protein
MARPHTRAWLSEFAGTTILLFASVLVTRWLFGPHSGLASAVPGLPGRMAIDGAVIGAVIASPAVDYAAIGPAAGAFILVVLVRALGLPQPLTCDLCGTPPRDAAPRPLMQPTGDLEPITPACQGASRDGSHPFWRFPPGSGQ